MLKLVIALFLVAGIHLVTPQTPPNVGLPSQQGLTNLLFNSPLMALHPQVSVACFTDYIAHLNLAGEIYSGDYKMCLTHAKEERKNIDAAVVVERNNIVNASETLCMNLQICNAQNSSMVLFECHSRIGADNTKFAYIISGNASEYATVLQERYRLVDLHHQQCCQSAERKYVTTTADNYNHLQACLEGRVKPRPPLTTTTTTTKQQATSTTITAATTSTTSPTATASTTSTTMTGAPSK